MHNFKRSLAQGQKGEELFLKLRPELKRLDGRKHDYINEATGETWELKSDSYTTEKTQNFFIELLSSYHNLKPGGPKQALANGTKYWAYLYAASNVYYVFETAKLVEELEKLLISEQLQLSLIPNKSWATIGAKVPRRLLAHIYTEIFF